MSEIVKEKNPEQIIAAEKRALKYKSSSKLIIFDASLQKSELVQQLEIKTTRNSFHTGDRPYLQNRDGQIVVNTKKCAHFVLPCIEYTIERTNLSDVLKQYDQKYSENLLNESLEVEKKLTILDKYEIELVFVNTMREDFFILRYSSTDQLTDPGQIEEEPFKELVKTYKETFKVDPKFLEYIFLNSLKDIETSERLLSAIGQYQDVFKQEETKQQQMLSQLNLKEFVGEKMLHLPVYKKDTGFFNYSQYQVLNLETQKLSEPKDVEKPNYNL